MSGKINKKEFRFYGCGKALLPLLRHISDRKSAALKNIFYYLLIFISSKVVGAAYVGTTQNFEIGDTVTQTYILNNDSTSTVTCAINDNIL